MALVAAHLGVVDEEQINNMSYIFFNDVLEALGAKLNYDAVVNYAGNSFCKESWDMIQSANPMQGGNGKTGTQNKLADFLSGAKTVKKGGKLPGLGFNGRDKRG